ncbi:tRNA (guanosine(37)-N1)-methyltransferase TrmD [Dichelobacter nodosus]|nr:tRNA (guanosine(37)-N1)-methyltransferase TrmD [Dichelobacter nodosus]AXM45793.1 tRNA (guanosine(37)-N1)-methyltransferase TrmD [Dichelobacter nodosus]KNZ39245.1 tRNA (guanine-N1)-methyltransferase [Dichelobacter nodosus]TGA64445.1 tRNA (guanosine(37)-N1)-methyltransferase TrmD [Dichelobacter nodosus]
MRIDFVSIFPQLIQNWFNQGIIARAVEREIVQFFYHNPRDFSENRYRRIDDRPFGGGPGMVMQYEPLAKTAEQINASVSEKPLHIYLSPQGEPFHNRIAQMLAQKDHLVLWCGRYEGIDQRFIERYIDLEISLGDFVLSGGEIAAAAVADAVCRFVPRVLGDEHSAQEDSFQNVLLDHPHYTRPENAGKIRAPEILLSGNHEKIARWRLKQALGTTFLRRPDLFDALVLTDTQKDLLNEFLAEYSISGEL